jgi:hypothetical protein
MGLITPKTSFDFETIDKGIHHFKVIEAKIEPQAEGKKSGRNFIASCAVVGGSQEGLRHNERFFEFTKDDFSLSKLAGFCIKIGLIKVGTPIDTAVLQSSEFADKWNKAVKGREFGAKIGWRYADTDKDKENPYSDMKAYYSMDEYRALSAGKGTTNQGTSAPAAETPTSSIFD